MAVLLQANAAPDPSVPYAWYRGDTGITVSSDGYTPTGWTNAATSGTTPSTRNLTSVGGAPYRWNLQLSGAPTHAMRFHGDLDGIWATSASFGTISGSRSIVLYARTRETDQGILFDCSTTASGLTRAQANHGNWQIGTVANGTAGTIAGTAGTITGPVTLNAWQVHSFILTTGTAPTFQHFINGVQAGSTVTLSQARALSGLILGNSVAPSAGLGCDVDLAEVLIYDKALDITSRQEAESYLTAKWSGVTDGANAPPDPIAYTSRPFTSTFTGTANNYEYRIPAMVTSNLGTVIVSADGRFSNSDVPGRIDNIVRRSSDNGDTWGPVIVTANYGTDTTDTDLYPLFSTTTPQARTCSSDPSLLVDRSNGRIWVFYDNGSTASYNGYGRTIKLEMRYSDDDGLTWSSRKDVEAENPALRPLANETFTFAGSTYTYGKGEYIVAPGSGIQLEHGTHPGRLILPVYWYRTNNNSSFIYSDDHGTTWQRGGICGYGTGEIQIAELVNGDLLATMRPSGAASGYRWFSRSTDGGLTWGPMFRYDSTNATPIADPACQGSIMRLSDTTGSDKNRLVQANCASMSSRINLTVRTSYDEGITWPVSRFVGATGGYSALTRLANGDIGLLYEKSTSFASIDFVRIPLSLASNGTDQQSPYTVWANSRFNFPQLISPLVSGPSSDPDQDGFTNLQEYLADTSPTDAASRLNANASGFQNGAYRVTLATSSSRNYTLYRSTDLGSSDAWIVVQGPVAGNGGTLVLQDPSPPAGRAFYRVGASVP